MRSVVPTLIQEVGATSKPIEQKLHELAVLPEVTWTQEELDFIAAVGDNRGCMHLKGASRGHVSQPVADQWGMNADLEAVARRWAIDPDRDLMRTHS